MEPPAKLEIVLLARDREKLREFTERGARVETGNLDDGAFVARATEGVDALFWPTPTAVAVKPASSRERARAACSETRCCRRAMRWRRRRST